MTDVVHGSNRQMWFSTLSQTSPTDSFLEDAVGTSITSGQVVRSQRLGDPINTGPNDTWHQLTWQGGAQQEIWADPEMYQKGNVDAISWAGKIKMWPGFQSWFKKEHHPNGCGFVFCQGTLADVDWRLTALYVGEGTRGPWEARAPLYHMYCIHPGYARGDSRAVRHVKQFTEPIKGIYSVTSDNYAASSLMVLTATKFYWMDESTQTLIQDTNAPLTGSQGYEFHLDCGVSYANGFFYGHGNRLYKRVPAPPYGVLGTHTKIHTISPAKRLTGMTVWNNRIYFGAFYPSGDCSVFVSDGATTVKAFDFPHEFYIRKMVNVAGSLYILGMTPSGLGQANHTPNIVQQLWRYDGTSLKKIWQEGSFDDGASHWFTDLAVYEGMVVWGANGTATTGTRTGVSKHNYACLMFYDPVNDAIVPGPGLEVHAANTNDLNIGGISKWNAGLMVAFKDNTNYGSSLSKPYMLATMRAEDQTRHDLRWPMAGDIAQFQDPASLTRTLELFTSEYHGPDDVANTKKVWLSVKLRVKITGDHSTIGVYVRSGLDDSSDDLIGTITNSGGAWQDIVLPIKPPSQGGLTYLKSKKIQIHLKLNNTDTNQPDSTDQAWVDDIAVQYALSPVKVRQWQVRIPISDNQLRADGTTPNPLSTAQAMEVALQAYYFNAVPFKFWTPTASGLSTPADNAYVEVLATSFIENDARLETGDTAARVGTISMTLVENVTNQ